MKGISINTHHICVIISTYDGMYSESIYIHIGRPLNSKPNEIQTTVLYDCFQLGRFFWLSGRWGWAVAGSITSPSSEQIGSRGSKRTAGCKDVGEGG